MAQHDTPRGEKSTAQANGKTSKGRDYEGKHRPVKAKEIDSDTLQGLPLGGPNRGADRKGGRYSR